MRNYYKVGLFILLCIFIASCSKSGSDLKVTTAPPTTTPPVITDTSKSPFGTFVYKISSPVSYSNAHNIVIRGLEIKNTTVTCINLSNCSNITISKCKLGPSLTSGIQLINCTNVTIDSCYILNVSTGLYALQSASIKFTNNEVKNVQGPYPEGQMLQFDNVSGAGNRVLNNRCENIAGSSNPEDAINMYKSNGTAADPIMIAGNWIRGGGPSQSGSGILLGDNGGSYIIAKDNILVNTGNCGIGVSGGSNIQVINNQVFSSRTSISNVGIYIWNQSTGGCSMNTISGNQVNWTNSSGTMNNNYDNGNCGTVTGWITNIWGAPINTLILPVQF